MTEDTATATATDRLHLADWRRRVAELYAEVRANGRHRPGRRPGDLGRRREALVPGPSVVAGPAVGAGDVPGAALAVRRPVAVRGRRRALAPVSGLGGLAGLDLPNSGADVLAFDRIGDIRLPLPDGEASLSLFWMRGYTGGLFLPFRDATSGDETYGAGRYVLDTGKGADLGSDLAAGTIVIDLNFSFQPSCAFDPRWACPLAPPENRLTARIEAGERLR